MKNINLSFYLDSYLRERPVFLSLVRAKEAYLYQKYLPLKKPVLDVGCGDGFFAKLAVGEVDIGLDLKNSRISESERVYSRTLVYDGLTIPFGKDSISTVMCNSVLEHVENLDRELEEMYRVLKKDGVVICPVMAKAWESNLLGGRILGNVYIDWFRKIQKHKYLLTPSQWRKRFEKAGFELVDEIGHLSPMVCALVDILHYWSIPNLILYKLTGKWTWKNKYFLPVNKNWLLDNLEKNTPLEKSGAIFFVWKKK